MHNESICNFVYFVQAKFGILNRRCGVGSRLLTQYVGQATQHLVIARTYVRGIIIVQLRGESKSMNANFEMTTEYGVLIMTQLTNVLLEEIDDTIAIHADNGFMANIRREDLEEEFHDDDMDIYRMTDGTEITVTLT